MCIGGGAERQEAGQMETAMADLARAEIDYWKKGGFKQLENDAILDAKKANSDNKRQIARGQAHVAAVSGMGLNKAPVLNPNTGASKHVAAGMGIAAGDALARASNDADIVQKKKSKLGLTEMAQFGRGQQQLANSALSTAANFEAGNNAANLALKRSADEFNGEMAGAVAGMAAGYGKGMFSDSPAPTQQWDSARNTVSDSQSGMVLDMGNIPNDWEMGAAKARTMIR